MPIVCSPLALPAERDELVAWLSSETWPFHVNAAPSPQRLRELIDAGEFSKPDQQTFWILEAGQRVGLVRLLDLGDVDDGNPIFDLRVSDHHRNQGLGREAVKWLTSHLFAAYQQLDRISGTTRDDNHAMRAVFRACGYVKEGHFREAWPASDGTKHDSVYYAILRKDWQSGSPTQVKWNDE